MTRPQLAALIATALEAREALELQGRVSDAQHLVAPAVKALDYTLALLESDLIERDEAEADLASPIPEPVRFAQSERAAYLPEMALAGAVYPTPED